MRLFKQSLCGFASSESEQRTLLKPDNIERLMHFVVHGDLAKAEAVLIKAQAKDKNDPEKPNLTYLLCTVCDTVALCGKPIENLTSFQVALSEGDVAAYEGDPQMCEMLIRYLKKIPHGLQIMRAQYKEIFPEGIERHIEQQKKQAKDFEKEITTLINCIIEADMKELITAFRLQNTNSPLEKAFLTFRHTVQTIFFDRRERVFNPYYLLSIYEIYTKNYSKSLNGTNKGLKRDLLAVQGIGFIQRYSPAWLLQSLANGLDTIIQKQALSRSVRYLKDPLTLLEIINPLTIDSAVKCRGLGFIYFLHNRKAADSCCDSLSDDLIVMEALISKKNKSLKELMHSNPCLTAVCAMGNS